MALDHQGQVEAERRRYSSKGQGFYPKRVFKAGLKAIRRRSRMRALTDDELRQALNAGWRVYDKQRGVYVHV